MAVSPPQWYILGDPCPKCGDVHMKCSEHTVSGVSCASAPVKDGWRCGSHGGKALAVAGPYVGDVDVQHLIETYASIGPLLEACHARTKGMTFAESVEDGLNRANSMVAMLKVLVGTLAPRSKHYRHTIAEGTPKEQDRWYTTEEGTIGPDTDGNLAVHPWVVLYKDWVQVQGQLAAKASDLGLVERQVRVQEVQIEMIGKMMMSMLDELDVNMTDPKAMVIIERHLMTLDDAVVDVGPAPLTATATAS